MRQKSGIHSATSEKVVKDIRRATRGQYSAEEEIRIVLDALRAVLRRQGPEAPSGLRGTTRGSDTELCA